MKNLILLFVLITTACFAGGRKSTKPVVNEIVVNTVHKADLVNVLSTKGFTDKEKLKLEKYIPVMNNTIASKCFEDFMSNRNVHTTNGKSIKQVVADLRTKKVDINLVTYYKNNRTKGYTYPNSTTIWLNRKFHKGASYCSEASNLAHELSHKIGYGHSFKASRSRPYTVPYSINAAFTVCCTK